MTRDLADSLRPALVLTLLFFALTGLAYPALITGVAQLAFPHAANGSLLRDGDRVIGSELIAQGFARPDYFHPRPSAAGKGYDAMASAGSNLGPAAKPLADRVAADLAALRTAGETGVAAPDRVTTSGSGLDPHLSPASALAQVARVAAARRLPEARVRALVTASIENPGLGIAGDPVVNVLGLNRQLDRIGAKPTP